MNIKIIRYETINYTPAVMLATEGWLEQNAAGIGEPSASIHWQQKAIVAFNDDTPMGVITWTDQQHLGAVFAEQVFVKPEWRRLGVFKAMWADLAAQARELKRSHIRLGTNPNNHVAQKVYETCGGEVYAMFFQFNTEGTTT